LSATDAVNKEKQMKKLVIEESGEGLIGLLGERVTLFCLNYIYTGRLVGVNDSCVRLDDAGIVYETGAFTDSAWKDAQKLPKPVYVMLSAVESFTVIR